MNRFDATLFLHQSGDHSDPSIDSEKGAGHFSDETECRDVNASDAGRSPAGEKPSDFGESVRDDSSRDDGSGGIDAGASSWCAALRAQKFFVPLHYEANYSYPLIVWLHSDGFNENQVSHVMPHVSTRNYVATGIRGPLALDANGHRFGWRIPGDASAPVQSSSALISAENRVFEAIDRAFAEYSIHRQRVVLAGYRSGGSIALEIARRHPTRFAASVSLGGRFFAGVESNESKLASMHHGEIQRPMLWQHAIESDWYNEGDLATDLKRAVQLKSKLDVRQYRMDDEMNTAVLSDLDRWIMSHVVSGQPLGKMQTWDSSPVMFSDN